MDSGIPEHCPGVGSEDAGKAAACAGCPNQNICSSAQTGTGEDPDIEIIKHKLSNVKNIIIVMSGKGGVGKSTVTSMLAQNLAEDQAKMVGVMDIDLCGPSMPRIFGAKNETVHMSGSGWSPVFVEENLCLMSIAFLLSGPDDAVIWRGPKKNGLIKQFLKDVDWGELDFLLVDTPPGTSDEHLSVLKYLQGCNVKGAIIVTTPQEASLLDVRKEINFCRKMKFPVIGVLENMSTFVCPECKVATELFPPLTGGAESMAKEMEVAFLGKIPITSQIGKSCDEGLLFMNDLKETSKNSIETICKLAEKIKLEDGLLNSSCTVNL